MRSTKRRIRKLTSGSGWRPAALPLTVASMLMALPLTPAIADAPPFSLGAGLRTSFTSTDNDKPGKDANDFAVDSLRLYMSGTVLPYLKFTVNTEYSNPAGGGDNGLRLMDAIGRFEWSDKLNIWAGRFLPPSDRANLYGPYYANNWKVYEDGVADGYPSYTAGRDSGVAYWGQFGILKVSTGFFDVPSTTSRTEVLTTARLQLDFWDPEPGYYLNGTYYGEKSILAVGIAGQTESDKHAFTADVLVEKPVSGVGTFTFESEYARYDGLGGYSSGPAFADSNGYYALVSWLLPQAVGPGKFQLLGKYGQAKLHSPADSEALPKYTQSTSELNLNYILKSFNARISLFFKNASLDKGLPDSKQYGLGLQMQI